MRTIEQAIQEELKYYVITCSGIARAERMAEAGDAHAVEELPLLRRRAHVERLALQRLRHRVVTEHEAVRAATPSVHAQGAGPRYRPIEGKWGVV